MSGAKHVVVAAQRARAVASKGDLCWPAAVGLVGAVLLATGCARTGFAGPPDPCAGVDCGGHGRCEAGSGDAPRCTCDPGYRPRDAITCVADPTVLDAASGDSAIADVALGDAVLCDASSTDTTGADAAAADTARADSATVDATEAAPWAPGLQTWRYRKRLLVPARAPAAQLTDFTLLVLRTDADLRDRALDSGFDLRFVDAAGNLLVHQRERFDGPSGALIAWVRLPVLDSATDTILYLYYGGDPAGPDPSSSAAWADDQQAVWHLDELAAGAAGEYVDSSGRGHHASSASSSPPTQVAGQIGDAQSLDGRHAFITTGSSLINGQSGLTLSLWTYLRAARGGLAGQNDVVEMGFYWVDRLNVWTSDIDVLCPGKTVPSACTPDFPLDAWFLAAVTWDGLELALFVDGVEKHRVPLASLSTSGDPFNIGGEIFEPSGGLLDGVVDEVHLASVARSPAWLALEHANQVAPEAFVVFEAEERRP